MMKSATAVKAKIKNKAGGDSDKSQIMLRIYLMERLLERVSLSQYRDNFVLKGGLLVSSMVGVDMRSTMDVDTTVKSLPLNKRSAQKILEALTAKKVAIFATLGADPTSEHAHKCLASATELVPAHTEVVDSFICQGAVDPKLIEMMYKRFPANSPHGKNPESEARHTEAAKHPDEADLAAARAFAERVTEKVSEA